VFGRKKFREIVGLDFSFSTIALIMLLLPAYSQQEVDPTRYDPCIE
jgi:hypothetical protein